MSSWTDEDEDGGTCPSSPSVTFIGRRRCARGQCRVWMPLPHFPGLSHTLNPIQYPPQLNFPPPPLMTPILIGVPPPPYSLPPPPIAALLAPALLAMQVVAPPVQANVASAPIPRAPPAVNPVAPATAPVLMAGGPPDPLPPHLQGLNQDPQLILTICQLADLPPPQHPQYGGAHLIHGSQLVDSTSQI